VISQKNLSLNVIPLLLLLLFAISLPSAAEIQIDEDGNPFEYIQATMSDGVKIALAIGYPREFDPENDTQKWPAILQMSGYPRQTKPAPYDTFAGLYVTVNASLRGTGASEGNFSYMSDRSIRDGYEVIEEWIVKQPWSDGKVGIHGHSWSGLTGFRIAAMNPPHLKAIVVSGIFDDTTRGIAAIGGIRNIGFPMMWTSNFDRPDGVFGSDKAAAENRRLSESESREVREDFESQNRQSEEIQTRTDPIRPKTYRNLAGDIRAPIFILHAYQDHETGPSGAWLFDYLPDDITKRLLISNGHHGMPLRFPALRRAWLDFWLRGEGGDAFPGIDDPGSSVQAFFEVENRLMNHNPPWTSSDFPLPETQWARHYLGPEGTLSTVQVNAGGDPNQDTYTVTSETDYAKIDKLDYRLTFAEPMAICGPITLTLWADSTAVDTDFFAVLSDIAPDGRVRPLQRGMLRASLRSLDEEMSNWKEIDGKRELIRPYHTLTTPQNLEPGKPYRFEIEIFPVGHVFREDHQLLLSISKPPLDDPVPYPWGRRKRAIIKSGSYKYESKHPDSTVTLYRSPEYPSSILLPLLPGLPSVSETIPDRIDKLWDWSKIRIEATTHSRTQSGDE
jgi:uncharacterized protein